MGGWYSDCLFLSDPCNWRKNSGEMGRCYDSIDIEEVAQSVYCSRRILNGCTTHMDSGKVHPI